ncbi:MAG TPA: hypothetical protein VK540_00540 [Polyangiaceae bacterium]|jgi:hypothetical protein|nr:hypothetical protein [Polyangiaceae bacterium]
MSRLEDPRARQQFADVMATAEMQRAMGEMSSALAKGLALGLSNDEMVAQLEQMSRRMTETMAESLARRMKNDVAPASAAVAAAAVEAAMHAAIRTAADELPVALAPAMRQALTESLGPAMEAVLRENVGRGLTAVASAPEFHAALGVTGRSLAREVVFGTNDALAELEERQSSRGLLARVTRLFASAGWLGWAIAAAVLLIATWWGVRRLQSRSLSKLAVRDRELRETVLLTLATTLRAAEGRPWADDLHRVLRDKIGNGEAIPGPVAREADPVNNGVRRDQRNSAVPPSAR